MACGRARSSSPVALARRCACRRVVMTAAAGSRSTCRLRAGEPRWFPAHPCRRPRPGRSGLRRRRRWPNAGSLLRMALRCVDTCLQRPGAAAAARKVRLGNVRGWGGVVIAGDHRGDIRAGGQGQEVLSEAIGVEGFQNGGSAAQVAEAVVGQDLIRPRFQPAVRPTAAGFLQASAATGTASGCAALCRGGARSRGCQPWPAVRG